MEYCLASNPPQYDAECCNGCGVGVRWFQRSDPFAHVTQAEVNAAAEKLGSHALQKCPPRLTL
jgi:hypothetical protein